MVSTCSGWLQSSHGRRVIDFLAARLRSGDALAGRARPRSAPRLKSGRRPAPGSRRKGSARGCSRCRIRTASGQAAPSSPPTSTSKVPRRPRASRGRRRRGRSTRFGSGASTPRSCASAARPSCSPRTARWEYDDLPYWGGEVDCCINAWTLANGVWLGADVTGIADWFVEHRVARRWLELRVGRGLDAVVVSLDAQLAQRVTGLRGRHRRQHGNVCRSSGGEEYLLRASLFRRLSTGDMVGPWVDPSAIRSGGSTTCSTPPTTSGRRRASTAARRTRGWPRRST